MPRSLSETLRSPARADDTHFPIRELFLDQTTHRVRYVAVDAGKWFETTEVIVAARLLRFDPDAGEWLLDLTHEAVEAAPRRDTESDGGTPLSVENWPPVVIGPFGHAASPLMIWAQMTSAAQETLPPEPPQEREISENAAAARAPAPDVDALEPASDWLGKPVFGADGEMGIVADLGLDPDRMELSLIVVDNDKLLSSRQAVFPMAAFRHRAGAGGHIVLDARVADMETAPTPEEAGLAAPGQAGFFAPL
ncbi:PRC-barrel domain-containing protein [Halodurantibacterium flavum]|uniref:PRC-barrel domain-containing protein n=1 Tax=Halodurantibacterium flavum TaxID=1382802 RepID=A0ABW4S460_9RHOB